MEARYSVRQTADKTGVKPYVLRYWEEELGITIQRNEMGHRYYTGDDIQLFLKIKELKKKGLQLRAVKDILPELMKNIHEETEKVQNTLKYPIIEKMGAEKLQDLRSILSAELKSKNAKKELEKDDTKILEFQSILERLILRELSSRDEEEEKCRSLDMAIRRQQLVRKEAAVASDRKNVRKTVMYTHDDY